VKRPKKPTKPTIDPRFAPVVAAFSRRSDVSLGSQGASLWLKANGRVFITFDQGRVTAKLPRERVDALVGQGKAERYDPCRNGKVMKEWVEVGVGELDCVALAGEAYRFLAGAKTMKESRRGT
jgi:hypothetical protein